MQLSSQTLSLSEKLNLLADAAKYDVACTSSGVNRAGKQGHLGNSVSCGICHSFSSDGRCISLLKILQSNDCIYDCKYCVNRAGNDRQRATFTPEEVCTLVTEFYRRNYIEGLFLSSAVCKNPAHTMELMYRTLHLLRNRYRFNGYIHVKAIPGAPAELIEKTGYLADRMSVNLELPTGEGLQKLAPQKTQKAILKPMRQIQSGIVDYRLTAGKSAFFRAFLGKPLSLPLHFRYTKADFRLRCRSGLDLFLLRAVTAGKGTLCSLRSCRPEHADDHRCDKGKRLPASLHLTASLPAV